MQVIKMADSKKTRRDDADGRQAALNAVLDQVEKQFFPFFWAWAITSSVRVVFPDDSGP